MTVVSSKDFAINQEKYFEMALNEQVFVQKGENIYLFTCFNGNHHYMKSPKRDIGFLEGTAKVTFHDDWSMTPEELGMI